MKRKIYETNINGQRIFLTNSKIFGWKVVYPIKIDGKVNIKNLLIGGSWVRFFGLVIFILLIYFCVKEYSIAVKIANECLSKSIQLLP